MTLIRVRKSRDLAYQEKGESRFGNTDFELQLE